MVRKHSLSFRIITRVLLITAVLFVLSVAIYSLFSRSMVRQTARDNAVQLAENMASNMQKELASLEKVPMTIGSALSLGLIHVDSIPVLLNKVLDQNTNIFGVGVHFEPNYFPEKGEKHAVFVHRSLQNEETYKKQYIHYNYFLRDWYQIPSILETPYWSEPYYSEIESEVVMATYSFPFYEKHEEQKTQAGIVTIDITLDWFTEMISGVQIFETGYAFMVSRTGTSLAHPIPSHILNESIFSSAEEWNAPMLREIGRDILAGKTNFRKYDRGDDFPLYMYHTTLPSSRWSIGVVYPEDEMFGSLQQMNLIMFIFIAGSLIILSVLTVQGINRITAPLGHFADSARQIAGGDFNVQLPEVKTKDEILELHGAFSHMQKQLSQYIANIKETTSAKEKIESELRIAHEIQMSMIPHSFPPFPDLPQIDLYAALNSAREVGGDLYDFFLMDKNKFCFAIGDVSGKGVPASLFMAVARTLLRSIAEKENKPSKIINSLNKSLAFNNHSCMFVTFFMGIIDLDSGKLTYVNAGHNPPVMMRKNGELAFFENSTSIPLGLYEEYSYEEKVMQLQAGEKIFCYTDGVNEAENAQSQLFGNDRMLNTLSEYKQYGSRELTEQMAQEVQAFAAGYPQSDDITIMIVSYNEKKDK